MAQSNAGERAPSSVASTTDEVLISPQNSVELARLKKQLERSRQMASELTAQITANNEQYVKREDELSQQLKEAGQRMQEMQRAQRRDAEAAAKRQVHVPADPKSTMRLSQQVEELKTGVAKHAAEEELTGIAVSRLRDHVAEIEKGSSKFAADVVPALQLITSIDDLSTGECRALGERISVQIMPKEPKPHPVVGCPALFEELCPSTIAASQSVSFLVSKLELLGQSLRDEGELRASVFVSQEATHRKLQQQLEEQSAVLLEAQAAITRLQQELADLEVELQAKTAVTVGVTGPAQNSTEELAQKQRSLVLEVAAATQRLTEIGTTRKAEQVALDESAKRLAAATGEFKELQATHRDATSAADSARQRCDTLKSERSALQQATRALEESHAALTRDLSRAQNDANETEKDLIVARQRLARLSEDQNAVSIELARRQRDLGVAEAAYTERQKQLLELHEQIKTTSAKLEERSAERQALKAEIQTLTEDAKDAEHNLQVAKDQLQYIKSLMPKQHPMAAERAPQRGGTTQSLLAAAITMAGQAALKTQPSGGQVVAAFMQPEMALPSHSPDAHSTPMPVESMQTLGEGVRQELVDMIHATQPTRAAPLIMTTSVPNQDGPLRPAMAAAVLAAPPHIPVRDRDHDGADSAARESVATTRSTMSIVEISSQIDAILKRRQAKQQQQQQGTK